MRVLLLCLTVVTAATPGCKPKQEPDKPAEGAQDPGRAEMVGRLAKLQEEEGDVLSRRSTLQVERKQVLVDRQALHEKRRQVAAAGGDVKGLDVEDQALVARETKLAEQEAELNKKLDQLIATYQQAASLVTPAAGAGAGNAQEMITRRETSTAAREKDFARRETAIAQRETTLAERERDLAKRERETCSAQTTTIVHQAAPIVLQPGAKYSRRDVEPVLNAARRKMGEKGLLGSDLPPTATRLEKEATDAMRGADWGKAKLAADQLYQTVDTIRVDRSFIVGKINRLNSSIKSSRLGSESQRQYEELFRDATADYGDGKFASANGKLNRIYALLP